MLKALSDLTVSCRFPVCVLLGVYLVGRNLFIASFFPHESLNVISFVFYWALGSVAHHQTLNILNNASIIYIYI